MKSSTATATTATASNNPYPPDSGYTGRFAPSPTGSLHLGSLLAAAGSFLDARCRGGRWLVRMEDLDSARIIRGSAEEILRTLERFGLHWDGAIEYQSRRTTHYLEALAGLRAAGATYECSCSRRVLTAGDARLAGPDGRIYPGTCRSGPRRPGPTSTRFRMDGGTITLEDRFQGSITFSSGSLGDVVVRRRDGVIAYQLAVVVDDALQGITDVVRGSDLLASTGWQLALQRALGLPTPRHGHLPVLTEPGGAKLAKSRRSVAIEPAHAGAELLTVLRLLNQAPPAALCGAPAPEVLGWAIAHWNPGAFRLTRQIEVK